MDWYVEIRFAMTTTLTLWSMLLMAAGEVVYLWAKFRVYEHPDYLALIERLRVYNPKLSQYGPSLRLHAFTRCVGGSGYVLGLVHIAPIHHAELWITVVLALATLTVFLLGIYGVLCMYRTAVVAKNLSAKSRVRLTNSDSSR